MTKGTSYYMLYLFLFFLSLFVLFYTLLHKSTIKSHTHTRVHTHIQISWNRVESLVEFHGFSQFEIYTRGGGRGRSGIRGNKHSTCIYIHVMCVMCV
jgi:hypothetical protein